MRARIEQLILFCRRRRAGVFAFLALLGLAALCAAFFRGRFTNDLSRLLPDTRETRAVFGILHETHLADSVQLEFISSDDVTRHAAYLERTARRLADSPLLRQVTFRFRSDDTGAEIAAFASLAPRFLHPDVLKECSPDEAAKKALKTLAFPVPGAVNMLRLNPFGWEKEMLARLKALDAATGMKLAVEFPFFVTPDRHRAMIAAETHIRLGDAESVRNLYTELRRCAAPLPADVELRIISGCSHTLGNEEVLKGDAAVACSVSLGCFLLLFLWAYRGDWRALWIPFLPLYASLLALGVMSFLFREICFYVIGLGSCITGLAVDQGIHVYAAFRGGDGERRVAALGQPMLLSAATSLAAFGFLALTGIAAYCQLAVFAGLSLVLSAFLALAVLPLLLDREHGLRPLLPEFRFRPAFPWGTVFVFLLLLLQALVPVLGRADFSLESMDGTPKEILAQEEDFRRAWRRSTAGTAMIAAAGADREAALEHLTALCAELRARKVPVTLPPRPPRSVQEARRRAWRSPETTARIAELEAGCRTACRNHHLPEACFRPIVAAQRKPVAPEDLSLPPLLEHIDRLMIKSHGRKAAAVAFLEDTPENIRQVRQLLAARNDEEAALLSRGGFAALIREELGGRFVLLLAGGVLAALLIVFLVFRNVGDVCRALVPVLFAWAFAAVTAQLTGFRATPAAAFAAVLLTGLAVDYGIYAVCQSRQPDAFDTRDPLLLSAATTIAGAGALLFSRHPVLFGTGAVLTPGILAACLSGVYLVPRLGKFSFSKSSAMVSILFVALLLSWGTGCAQVVPWREYPRREELRKRMEIYPERPFRIHAVATAAFPKREFRFLLAARIDPVKETVELAGVDPGSGALLFRNSGIPGEPPRFTPLFAERLPAALRAFPAALSEDLRRIFMLKRVFPLDVEEKEEYIFIRSQGNVTWKLRNAADGAFERCAGGLFSGAWSAGYREKGRRVAYRRSGVRHYSLELEIRQIVVK
ncbi:MAG: hypothetical protein IJT50_01750 [Lentisphaeria bacterium]|nr:hypothetical protein [Lentisphaeria bacterium]